MLIENMFVSGRRLSTSYHLYAKVKIIKVKIILKVSVSFLNI